MIVAGVCSVAPAVAHAESPEELRAKGQQLAKDGRFTEAIDSFKASNKLEPRASNDCLIALAYTRRELWPQAEIFLDQCHRRASAQDPLPDWVPMADQQLAERLANVNVAAVEIKVEPAGTDVMLAVSSFAPDELFEPRTIHLPPGHHVIVATATGYERTQQTIDVTDTTPQTVTVTLRRPGEGVVAPVPAPVPTRSSKDSKVPFVVIGAGAGLLAVGAAVHLFVFKPVRDDLQRASDANNDVEWRRLSPKFDRARITTIGLYAAGALTVGVGVILKATVFEHHDEVQVSAIPLDGGGMVTMGWTR